MSEWIRAGLDLILIGLVSAGLVQAVRLIRQLAGLQQGRVDMERFVHEFNSTVMRAEAGIKGLRQTARDTGDDLEKLVEKAMAVRDDLQIIVSSADKIAERLSQSAQGASKPEAKASAPKTVPEPKNETAQTVTPLPTRKDEQPAVSSRAEKELLQALQKLS